MGIEYVIFVRRLSVQQADSSSMARRMVGLGPGSGWIPSLGIYVYLTYSTPDLSNLLNLTTAPVKWNCLTGAQPVDRTCTYHNNKGWRYLMYTSGALVLVMSIARITVIRLKETPKYLLGEGNDAQIVDNFQKMASRYNRQCSITVELLEGWGTIRSAHGSSKYSVSELTIHLRGLFATKKIALSTVLIWLSWTLIGLAYPLFYVLLSTYLATRSAQFGNISTYDTWRNYALVNISGIPVSTFTFNLLAYDFNQSGPHACGTYGEL